ncbi:MAG: nucleotidyltransferase domain-containing protein [Thermoanaerobaculia bacterium]
MRSIDQIELSAGDRRAISDAAALLRERFPVAEIVLFGSEARGTDDPESDIDLLLVTSRSLSWREHRSVIEALFDLEMKHEVVISTVIVSREDWLHGPYAVLPIRREIEKDGVAA